jgi:hypothetical protein
MSRCREVEPDLWEAACAAAACVPLQQSTAYGAALARRGRIVRRWLIEGADGRTLYGMQAATRRIAGIAALTTALRGPFPFHPEVLAAGGAPLAAAIRAMSRPWPHALICAPELDDGAAASRAMRDARLRRVMTPQALAMTDLRGDTAALRRRLDGKWRNRLVKAEAAGLRVDIARGGAAMTWLCGAHGRLMRTKGFRGLPPEFIADLAATSARRDVFVCTAEHRRQTIAAALFLRHGAAATYLAAAAEPEARARHAGNLLLWRGLVALQESGVATCDLGTIDTDRSPSLARFKLGAAARIFVPCGTWTPSPL